MKKYEYPIIYFVIVVGILSIGFSVYFFSKTWFFKNKAFKTTGRIISVNSRLGGKNKIREYSPVIAFTTGEGEKLTFESDRYTLSSPTVGEYIDICYTTKPLYAVENNFMSLWGIPLFLAVLGVVLITFGVLAYNKFFGMFM